MQENRLKLIVSLSVIFLSFSSLTTVNFTVITVNANTVTTTHSLTSSSRVIKIMCYNIQDSGRAPEFLDVLKEENADIIMLDETDTFGLKSNEKLTEVVNELNNYFVNEDPYQGSTFTYCDETFISRFPIIETQLVKPLILDDGTEYTFYRDPLHAVVEVGETNIHLIGVHFKCCGDIREPGVSDEDESRKDSMEGIINYIDTLGDVPVIYLGDFNSYSPFDTGELSANVANLGSGPIDMLLNESNPHASKIHTWIDSYRELNPHDQGYSYIDAIYQSRIDFIFVNKFFEDKLINATVGDTPSAAIGSDHFTLDLWLNMDGSSMDGSTSNLRYPFQVSGLDGTILSHTEISLTWTPNSEINISHYLIYRDDAIIGNATNNNYQDSSLIAGQNYRFAVAAVDTNSHKGMNSKPILVNTSYGVITKPASPILNGTAGDQEVTLTWEMNVSILPILEYRLHEIVQNASGSEVISLKTTVSAEKQTFTVKNLVNGQNYSFTITAVSELGESAMSNRVTLTPHTPVTTTSKSTSASSLMLLVFGVFIIALMTKRKNRYR